jgi:hypothetical protein
MILTGIKKKKLSVSSPNMVSLEAVVDLWLSQ